jgi:AcrR family transcriptional regulator
MSKGFDTQTAILRQALDLSSEIGLEGLTIGALAKRVGMSKSGLYAHFESKEDLQRHVLDAAAERLTRDLVKRVFSKPRGLPRVRAMFDFWLYWVEGEFSGGCPFISASFEFDDRKGPVRDNLVTHFNDVLGSIAKSAHIAVEEGHFRDDLDVDQFAFDFWATLLAYHHYVRLMHRDDARMRARRAFEDLIQKAEKK